MVGKVRAQKMERPAVAKIHIPLVNTIAPKPKTEKTPSPLMPSITTGELISDTHWTCDLANYLFCLIYFKHLTFIKLVFRYTLFSFVFLFSLSIHAQLSDIIFFYRPYLCE
jgi:hypothetical protein